MRLINQFLGNDVTILISGGVVYNGMLIDIGSELLVIFNGEDYIYIPFQHIQNISLNLDPDEEIEKPENTPFEGSEEISLRKILNSAKGTFVEIHVVKNRAIHGYITSILNDYFVFYSPVFKTMFISLNHLKALIPYNPNQIPYALNEQRLPVKPTQITLARSFEEQLKKWVGKIVVFDLGESASKIGKFEQIEDKMIELVTARDKSKILNLRHIKTVHFPIE
ncbi:DUF2642 domain-containing protein [Virgibacillus oceani]|uniref:DUF2642 domain-containing protein n=1 Tax=Virgibacillus oceani TaxID=1479511 RepID=A0A917M428_9BACI|nr:DUF2642 domain-containing protein [Virgibacillus oceani]GGG76386.1 hypothetical protein GCM10011398_21660 [Virgibacillus oceani]